MTDKIITMADFCPRCESTATDCLGYSLCHGDKCDRIKEMRVLEYYCKECGLFYKQVEEE